MEFAVGDILLVDGERYCVIGKILYKNVDDNCRWSEYRIKQQGTLEEKWLSYDDTYNEYSLSWVVGNISKDGFHEVDRGTEEVLETWGKVDVKAGDRAAFYEYEDSTEEKIISVEQWEDGEEISSGYYLDWDEVSLCREENGAGGKTFSGNTHKSENGLGGKIMLVCVVLLAFIIVGRIISSIFSKEETISTYLEDNKEVYTYETSITGNSKEKAEVYRSQYDLDGTVKDIIDGIEGQTEDVQQNTEDGDSSVAILTEEEYCLVYLSEEQEVLVQVCSRKYAYTTDKAPYHAHIYTHNYYRRYYYSRGYYSDIGSFGKNASPYDSYEGGTVERNYFDSYNNYSSSVRQSSANNRYSSGGGLSSGK